MGHRFVSLQVPTEFFEKFGPLTTDDKPGYFRRVYHAMVSFADTQVRTNLLHFQILTRESSG